MIRSLRPSTAVILLSAVLLSACAGRDDRPRLDNVSLMNGPKLFSTASDFKERKQYREAAQGFSLMAGWGRGWEVAQYQLGVCLLAIADNPAANDSPKDLRREAFVWIKLAADSGNKSAQSRLALMLRDGIGISPDLQEAARYAILAEQGSGDIPLVRSAAEAEVSANLQQRLKPADWDEAKRLARNFSPIIQSARQPTPGTRPTKN
ncbi:tetratricopeptide repeat protein [Govanella unica]|uniref:Sel1 repeat family protein n=1 Tax=Govanella unica TaxID=2975056 RepID=A0A9X3TWY3_9PROT|nr:hypothetical protein [Govania unica]MDA5193104.1 hypothetical protein [Govania unica]